MCAQQYDAAIEGAGVKQTFPISNSGRRKEHTTPDNWECYCPPCLLSINRSCPLHYLMWPVIVPSLRKDSPNTARLRSNSSEHRSGPSVIGIPTCGSAGELRFYSDGSPALPLFVDFDERLTRQDIERTLEVSGPHNCWRRGGL